MYLSCPHSQSHTSRLVKNVYTLCNMLNWHKWYKSSHHIDDSRCYVTNYMYIPTSVLQNALMLNEILLLRLMLST